MQTFKARRLGIPKFYFPMVYAYQYSNDETQLGRFEIVNDTGIDYEIEEILKKILRHFHIKQRILPPIIARVSSNNGDETENLYAYYYTKLKTIVLNDKKIISAGIDFEFVVARELIHYIINQLSGRQVCGFSFIKNKYLYGDMFNEGFINYILEQVYGMKGHNEYVFATYIARQFANILGAGRINDLFFLSNICEIAKDFNEKLGKYYGSEQFVELANEPGNHMAMAPFEIFCGNIEYAEENAYRTYDETTLYRKMAGESAREMLQYYANLSETCDLRAYNLESRKFFKKFDGYTLF